MEILSLFLSFCGMFLLLLVAALRVCVCVVVTVTPTGLQGPASCPVQFLNTVTLLHPSTIVQGAIMAMSSRLTTAAACGRRRDGRRGNRGHEARPLTRGHG
jgi:hypothetical protein